MLESPSRSSMWRVGFSTPPDYDDNESFCGDTVSYGRSKEENGGSVEMPIMISRTNTRLLMEGLHTESE